MRRSAFAGCMWHKEEDGILSPVWGHLPCWGTKVAYQTVCLHPNHQREMEKSVLDIKCIIIFHFYLVWLLISFFPILSLLQLESVCVDMEPYPLSTN